MAVSTARAALADVRQAGAGAPRVQGADPSSATILRAPLISPIWDTEVAQTGTVRVPNAVLQCLGPCIEV